MSNTANEWVYGSQQSPIKLETSKAMPVVFPADYLVVQYPNEPLAGHFNHQNHNFYFDNPPVLQFDGREAKLERIHIHSRSEHWLDQTDFDFEIHFVNPLPTPTVDPTAPTGDSTNVVLGVFFKESITATTPKSIRALNEAIKTRMTSTKKLASDSPKVDSPINPCDFLPANRSQFFRYEGSLTTPDDQCKFKERVSWVVYPHLIEVNPKDVAELKLHAHEEARIPQDLNRRFVLRNFV